MNLDGFLIALEGLPGNMVESLFSLWNRPVDWAAATIAPRLSVPDTRAQECALTCRRALDEETGRVTTRVRLKQDSG